MTDFAPPVPTDEDVFKSHLTYQAFWDTLCPAGVAKKDALQQLMYPDEGQYIIISGDRELWLAIDLRRRQNRNMLVLTVMGPDDHVYLRKLA